MLLVVAGAHDADAARLVDRLGPSRAALLAPVDLSRPGWRLMPHRADEGTIVAGGRVIPERQISAILVRRLAVYAEELAHVHVDDRSYVANEMNALLAWWLHAFARPVLNRPANGVLCGPFARPEQWQRAARRLGIPTASLVRTAELQPLPPPARYTVTVVGDMVVTDASAAITEEAARLACACAARVVSMSFDSAGLFLSGHCFPRFTDEIIRAIVRCAEAPVSASVPARMLGTPGPMHDALATTV